MFDKRHFLLYLFVCFTIVLRAQTEGFPVIKFDEDTADFGIVREGDTVRYDFNFTNVGTADLIIKQAWPACGCTHPSYTEGAIKPGERGVIHVEFLSVGWGGHDVIKEVIIISNAPENYARFKAKIIKQSPIQRNVPVNKGGKKKKGKSKAKG